MQDARAADLEAEDEWMRTPASRWLERVKKTLYLSSLVMLTLVVGYCLGRNHEQMKMNASGGGHSAETTTTTTATGKTSAGGSGLMSPQDFLPESEYFGSFGASLRMAAAGKTRGEAVEFDLDSDGHG